MYQRGLGHFHRLSDLVLGELLDIPYVAEELDEGCAALVSERGVWRVSLLWRRARIRGPGRAGGDGVDIYVPGSVRHGERKGDGAEERWILEKIVQVGPCVYQSNSRNRCFISEPRRIGYITALSRWIGLDVEELDWIELN